MKNHTLSHDEALAVLKQASEQFEEYSRLAAVAEAVALTCEPAEAELDFADWRHPVGLVTVPGR